MYSHKSTCRKTVVKNTLFPKILIIYRFSNQCNLRFYYLNYIPCFTAQLMSKYVLMFLSFFNALKYSINIICLVMPYFYFVMIILHDILQPPILCHPKCCVLYSSSDATCHDLHKTPEHFIFSKMLYLPKMKGWKSMLLH